MVETKNQVVTAIVTPSRNVRLNNRLKRLIKILKFKILKKNQNYN
jgi:hypothetical protein